MNLEPGQIVAGKYELERVLGQGGMGTVISAVHVHLRERVAIKILSREAAEQKEATSRFMREARAAARIKSEHVAKVSDVGTLPDGTPYIVMEYLDGFDLADTLAQRGPLPVDEALELVLQACEALAEAHSLGIVHRDLKPANLFLTHRADGTPSVKVLDFGISKVTHPGTSQAEAALTHTTTIMGSPLYMSPEQIRATRGVDLRTDIWSLGVILYELLTGEAPFLGQTLPDISVKIAVEPPPPLRTKRPELSGLLEAVVLKCLEKDRDNRFRTLGEFALALLELAPPRARMSIDRVCGVISAAGLPESVLPSGVAPTGNRVITDSGSTGNRVITGESSAETVSTFGTTASNGRSKRTLWVVAGVAVVAAAAAAAVVLAKGGGDPAAATAAPAVELTAPAPPKVDVATPAAPGPAPVVAPALAPTGAAGQDASQKPAQPHAARPRPAKAEPKEQPSAAPPPAPASAPPPAPAPAPATNLLDSRK
ncbi:MAG TPA: serine/threonine-protein kinase [Polyangiaceae bacterium]